MSKIILYKPLQHFSHFPVHVLKYVVKCYVRRNIRLFGFCLVQSFLIVTKFSIFDTNLLVMHYLCSCKLMLEPVTLQNLSQVVNLISNHGPEI